MNTNRLLIIFTLLVMFAFSFASGLEFQQTIGSTISTITTTSGAVEPTRVTESPTVATTKETSEETTDKSSVETSTTETKTGVNNTETNKKSGPSQLLRTNVMRMQYEKLACRIEFYKSLLERAKEQGTVIVTEDLSSSLETHRESLRTAADRINRNEFNDAMKSLREDVKGVVGKYNKIKETTSTVDEGLSATTEATSETTETSSTEGGTTRVIGGNTKEKLNERTANKNRVLTRRKLIEDFSNLKKEVNTCLKEASKNLGRTQIESVKAWKEQAKDIARKLKEKGLQTSELENTADEIDASTEALESSMENEDTEKIEDAQKTLREKHLKIWAKFHVVRMRLLLDAIDARAEKLGLSTEIKELKQKISELNEKIRSTESFDDGEFQQLQTELKETAEKLRDLFTKIKEMR